jgi:hypothetical protein
MPTAQQLLSSLRISQWISTCYLPITFIRYDDLNQVVYIEAGEEIKVIVYSNGELELYEY